MNVTSWMFWGFVATVVLSTIMAGSQGLRLTRISLPYLIGSMVTPSRDRASVIGLALHLVNGWLFSLFYVLAFESWHRTGWWLGAGIGLVQAAFVLTVGVRLLPAIHPRMASERQGPTVVRQLEPPGFLALNYGYQTPLTVVIAHLAFGAILGGCYRLG
ncbi:MAG: hypothetical protein HY700_08885 [Gemmatimonadetes bacterium]|nr:hypothetical protein [Gemmatimonadota bacterium]